MRDLDLGRRLQAGDVSAAELGELAERTPQQRGPYLGAVLALLAGPAAADPVLRASAIRTLDGLRGVPGVRALVAALDDADAGVRAAAVEALRTTARAAPVRFAHALFHGNPEVRRGALGGELVQRVAEIAVYLRADPDPETAARARELAWPGGLLPLAFELHATGAMSDLELAARIAAASAQELRTFVDRERGRTEDVLAPYLDAIALVAELAPPPGRDVLDTIFHVSDERMIETLVGTLAPRAYVRLAQRALAAALGALARGDARPAVLQAAAALGPALLRAPWLPPARVAVAAAGLVRHGWPIRPPVADVELLLALPPVRDAGDGLPDLAAAAAIAGLLPAQRLRAMSAVLGDAAIVAALVARDAGWDVVCKLPGEDPAVEQIWLAGVAAANAPRYVALAGRAVGLLADKRLEAFLTWLPQQLEDVLFAALTSAHAATDDRVIAVATTVTTWLPMGGLARAFARLLAPAAPLGALRLVLALVRAANDAAVAVAAAALSDAEALALTALWDGRDVPPRSRELAVAEAFAAHRDSVVRAWSARARGLGTTRVVVTAPVMARGALTAAEARQIAKCIAPDLELALVPALRAPMTGVVAALVDRVPAPSTAACAALMGCADSLIDVARELDRFAAASPKFEGLLDDAVGDAWLSARELPPLAHARLWRWEAHTAAFGRWIAAHGGVLAALRIADALPGWLARATLWRGVAEHVTLVRYRDRAALAALQPAELGAYAAERVDHPIGREAARIVVALIAGGAVPGAAVRESVLERISDSDLETRDVLGRIVHTASLPPPPARPAALPAEALLAKIRACRDLDELAIWCTDVRPPLVHEAVLALLLLGEPGEARLAQLLGSLGTLMAPLPLLTSIAMWESPAALAVARALADTGGAALPPVLRFQLGLALVSRGERDQLARVFAAVRAPVPGDTWFRRDDWVALERVANSLACAIELAGCAHHHAYRPAVQRLLACPDPLAPDVAAALHAFLEADVERPVHLRRAAAQRLVARGERAVLPLVVEHATDERADDWTSAARAIPPELHDEARARATDAALIGGEAACSEKRMLALFAEWPRVSPAVAAGHWARILDEATTKPVRRVAAMYAVTARDAADRLGRVADVFAWGVRRGVELTGKLFAVHMTSAEKDLGHTYLDTGARIFVSPLPMLRGEEHGQDVVEGLILHELGHHVYHRGEVAQALWKRAHTEGLGQLLNLVADEHLERNLRAVDRAYGDRLKRLDAYAFQHAAQELALEKLLAALRGSAARALIAAELGVAFAEHAVRLRRGAILSQLARAGHPLARFARALRMGLGNRERDPLVEQALALCRGTATGKELRHLGMPELYALTRQLADLFGGAIACAQVFGGPEGLGFGEREDDVFGAGISDEALQKEVQRVLDPRTRSARGKGSEPSDRLWINVAPDAEFDKIKRVERLRGDPALHAALALAVRRHATRLRAHLDALGLVWTPQKARTAGRALDRSRLRALVTRGDPRILIAREPVRRTDLFLGIIVDCSGSMQAGQNIERAKKFAVLVAEACREVTGVEARLFGFTDSVIYDVGDARDCAVTALRSSGGNNDAAALYHVANLAAAARQRAKIIVMISDGLPTECSVEALRSLVVQLSRRRGILCAQVAVRALDEVCFPHYIVLDDANPDVAVARFGRMIARLAGKALGAA